MREIKFRAWHPCSKEEFGVAIIYFDWNDPSEAIQMGKLLSFRDMKVMQFTGLKDKNGKEIYEGDIVQSVLKWGGKEFKSSVMYFSESLQFGFSINQGESFYDFTDLEEPALEVIGNIHENPELLSNE